ncbi:DUF4055 domain-containing protein [Bradyrhizobium elkanii]|uniref:DUF4055 domain-containing protein n=1 Tax=Bradyrhizobium elkanii TaxID=29448 RepID=UPI003517916F
MQTRTAMLRAVYGGTETMRAQGATFLPQYEKESDTRYQARLASTFALNKLREAVDAASAKPFRTLLKVQNGDPDLDLWTQDIDLQGNHLHIFGHQYFNNSMLDGMCHLLVDHPDTYNMKSLADQKASGARPFMKMYKVDDVAAAYDMYVGGDTKTVHVRIRSQRAERDGFKEVLYNQIRVIEIDPTKTSGIVQLWEQKAQSGGSNWDFIEETPLQNMAEVPFVTMYAGEKEADYLARPIFIDLAYKQIEHWISSSDQRSILSAARFPMLACSGVQIDPEDEKQFAIGPYKVLYAPEANGRWYYVEPRGTAIESGAKDLDKLEMQMDMMALNPVTGTHRQYVPQNERDIQETRVHSVVHDMAINCQDALGEGDQVHGAVDRQGLQPGPGDPEHRVLEHQGSDRGGEAARRHVREARHLARDPVARSLQAEPARRRFQHSERADRAGSDRPGPHGRHRSERQRHRPSRRPVEDDGPGSGQQQHACKRNRGYPEDV